MELSVNSLKIIMPGATKRNLERFTPQLMFLPAKFGINRINLFSAFIAQCAHECGEFRNLKEKWGPTKWQKKYEGRLDLGNKYPGDGKKFCGRGLLQITGREMYERFGKDFFSDKTMFTKTPELVEEPYYAVLSAIWYWNMRKINQYADVNNFEMVTKKINTAKLGYKERTVFWKRARTVLSGNNSFYN